MEKEEIIVKFIPKVIEIARLYEGQGVLLEDLVGEGNLALTMVKSEAEGIADAQERENFMAKKVMEAMEALVSKEADASDVGERVLDKVNRVAEAAEEAYRDYRRKIKPGELAEETDLTVEEITEAYKLSGGQIDTLDIEDESR